MRRSEGKVQQVVELQEGVDQQEVEKKGTQQEERDLARSLRLLPHISQTRRGIPRICPRGTAFGPNGYSRTPRICRCQGQLKAARSRESASESTMNSRFPSGAAAARAPVRSAAVPPAFVRGFIRGGRKRRSRRRAAPGRLFPGLMKRLALQPRLAPGPGSAEAGEPGVEKTAAWRLFLPRQVRRPRRVRPPRIGKGGKKRGTGFLGVGAATSTRAGQGEHDLHSPIDELCHEGRAGADQGVEVSGGCRAGDQRVGGAVQHHEDPDSGGGFFADAQENSFRWANTFQLSRRMSSPG